MAFLGTAVRLSQTSIEGSGFTKLLLSVSEWLRPERTRILSVADFEWRPQSPLRTHRCFHMPVCLSISRAGERHAWLLFYFYFHFYLSFLALSELEHRELVMKDHRLIFLFELISVFADPSAYLYNRVNVARSQSFTLPRSCKTSDKSLRIYSFLLPLIFCFPFCLFFFAISLPPLIFLRPLPFPPR